MTAEPTIADRLFAVSLETTGLPTPQRVMKAGLKRITVKDMRDRFALDAVEKAHNIAVKAKLIADVCTQYGFTELPFGWEVREEVGTNALNPFLISIRLASEPRPTKTWREYRHGNTMKESRLRARRKAVEDGMVNALRGCEKFTIPLYTTPSFPEKS